MPAAFYPHAQHYGQILYTFVVRYTGQPNSLTPEIRKAVGAVDSNLAVSDPVTLTQLVASSVLSQRIAAELSTVFGVLAAFLACIGIYGVVSYGIARRTNEFGIRMALGAERQDVLWMVLRETAKLVFAGLALGLVLALACTRLVQTQLFGVNFYDPFAVAVAISAMLIIALFAGYLPARRATRIDPLSALRYE
jgi:ABC-type antimicrobial peptide transport system permease subunit